MKKNEDSVFDEGVPTINKVPVFRSRQRLSQDIIEEQEIKIFRKQPSQDFNSQYLFQDIDPEDPKQPLVLSNKRQMGAYSFIPKDQIISVDDYLYAPPPVYLKKDQYQFCDLIQDPKIRFQGVQIMKDGEMKCNDTEILKKFNGMIGEMIKGIAKSMAEGRGIVGVSLPIRIFEPRSYMERMIDQMAFIPYYLSNLQSNNPIDRMKAVISSTMAGLTTSISQLKGFNPQLGETYQGYFRDGTEIFTEYISHHPPIIRFLIIGKKFKYYGYQEMQAKPNYNYNTIKVCLKGPNTVKFNDGQEIHFNTPSIRLQGLVLGDRLCARVGKIIFTDMKNKIKTVVQLGKKGKGYFSSEQVDQFEGQIYYFDPKIQINSKKEFEEKSLDKLIQIDFQSQICDLQGSYLKELIIGIFYNLDGKKVWDINLDLPQQFFSLGTTLPSDCLHREDILWMKNKRSDYAQKWKLRLEDQQRKERKLRLEYK